MLTYTAPRAAADALRWRHSTLDLARERAAPARARGRRVPVADDPRARVLGLLARRARRRSTSAPTSPTRWCATSTPPDDEAFEREVGLELLVETARLWRSLGHHDPQGRFRIDGVTGPDEYSAIADNNVYTNLMAQRNLRAAADAVGTPSAARSRARRRLRGGGGLARRRARAWSIPWDDDLGVHPQSEGFTDHELWDFARTAPDQYPLLLHFPYFDLYRKQVVKQADLVLALHVRGDAFTDEEKARDFAYYEALTVRDSSLSACTQAVVAAEVGHLELAYDYFGEAALMDLHDLERQHRATACTSRRSPAPGSRPWPASAACATTTASSPSRPRLPRPARAARLPPARSAAAGSRSRSTAGRRDVHAARGRAARARAPR